MEGFDIFISQLDIKKLTSPDVKIFKNISKSEGPKSQVDGQQHTYD